MALYDDLINNDTLTREQKAEAIKARGVAERKAYDTELNKTKGRMLLGSLLSGASMHPIFNVPYVGTGVGGAMYDAGQAIVEGDKLPDIAKRAGRGFAIGETVGAIPYVGKAAGKTKAGQVVGNQASKLFDYLADTKAGQKLAEIAPKVEDVLMTDIKVFNPNKQTVYHGSPYDFAKFSNEAIGTGEGAQAHGYGHYTALDKDVADIRYRKGLSGTDGRYKYKDEILPEGFHQYYDAIKTGNENTLPDILTHLDQEMSKTENLINRLKNNSVPLQESKDLINAQNLLSDYNKFFKAVADFENVKLVDSPNGQLYKLSIPKDDVMLREDLGIWEQPQKVQGAILKLSKELNEKYPGNQFVNDFDNIIFNGNGKDLYKTLWQKNIVTQGELPNVNEELNAWKLASQDLSKHGIKGISYNGGIDGEARVIFNPDDIEIVRKYYNQPNLYDYLKNDSVLTKGFRQNKDIIDKALLNSVRRGQAGLNPLGKRQGEILYNEMVDNTVDLTNNFDKTPTIQEVKSHIKDLIDSGKVFDTLDDDWKIDVRGGNKKIKHLANSSQYEKMNKGQRNRHNKYVMSLENLINNSKYTNNPKANTKLNKKPNIDTYHYFETNVKIGDKKYKVILNAEQYKGESTIKPQTVHLYDVLEIK